MSKRGSDYQNKQTATLNSFARIAKQPEQETQIDRMLEKSAERRAAFAAKSKAASNIKISPKFIHTGK
jgi:hypothetical protein